MTEQICWGSSEKLLPILHALDCPSESLMMLERLPNAFLSDDQQKNGICLQNYDASENIETYERGRIFHNKFELRWEKQVGVFVIVYIGETIELPIPHNIKSLSDFVIQNEKYYLWGEKMPAAALKLMNQPEAINVFLEIQIPRLLHYPVLNQTGKKRVKISVRHYLNPETGDLEFYRFRHLEVAT